MKEELIFSRGGRYVARIDLQGAGRLWRVGQAGGEAIERLPGGFTFASAEGRFRVRLDADGTLTGTDIGGHGRVRARGGAWRRVEANVAPMPLGATARKGAKAFRAELDVSRGSVGLRGVVLDSVVVDPDERRAAALVPNSKAGGVAVVDLETMEVQWHGPPLESWLRLPECEALIGAEEPKPTPTPPAPPATPRFSFGALHVEGPMEPVREVVLTAYRVHGREPVDWERPDDLWRRPDVAELVHTPDAPPSSLDVDDEVFVLEGRTPSLTGVFSRTFELAAPGRCPLAATVSQRFEVLQVCARADAFGAVVRWTAGNAVGIRSVGTLPPDTPELPPAEPSAFPLPTDVDLREPAGFIEAHLHEAFGHRDLFEQAPLEDYPPEHYLVLRGCSTPGD